MSINTRHALHPLALALAVTLALAACGGNQDTPQTTAPGPQTKADTGLPATTLDTADTPEAAQTSASGRATKAVATADTPPLSENRKMLRGDVLIQALLSRTARLDAQNNPQTAWLSPETYPGAPWARVNKAANRLWSPWCWPARTSVPPTRTPPPWVATTISSRSVRGLAGSSMIP